MSEQAGTTTGWVGREARQARLEQLTRKRRDAERQIASFREHFDRLGEQLRDALADGRKDYARELLSRRLSLRARLSEVEGRCRTLVEEERRLAADDPADPPTGPVRTVATDAPGSPMMPPTAFLPRPSP